MKKKLLFKARTVSLFVLMMVSLNGLAQDQDLVGKIKGSWSGPLKVGAAELTLVINIIPDEKNNFTVTIDSPDQGVKGIATSKVTVTLDSLVVKSAILKGSYEGAFSDNYSTLNGKWKQSGMTFPLDLHHSFDKYSINRPQEPKPPYPYLEREVIVKNEKANVELAGTLTTPQSGGPFPAVILITGSGPQNRDEELMGHKPFLVLADYLTRKGLAVLRVDDRGIAKSSGKFSTATTLDFATDVSAEVDFLKKQKDIDSTRIGLLGHSEGGLIAPIVASERKDIAFIVLLAGPGVTGEKILLSQVAILNRRAGLSDKEVKDDSLLRIKIYSIIKKNPDNNKASEKIKSLIKSFAKKNPDEMGFAKMDDNQLNLFIQQGTSAWFRTFLILDPVNYLSKVQCPLLALNGSLDIQVPAKENLPAIEKAMIFGGNSNYSMEEMPGLNHLFQHATTGNIDEYSKIEETMSPDVLEKIAVWINKIWKR
ncbi:MAG: alpha/beta hydrolase [Bacteroidales bacterium]